MVFAFEAAPLIAPYLESCAVELAAGRPIPPAPVPPTGSTADFLEYVRSHDKLRVCSKEGVRASRKRWRRIKECVFALPEMVRNMTSLSADPVLGSRETVDARLAAARLVRCRTHWRLGALMNLSLFSPAYIPHY